MDEIDQSKVTLLVLDVFNYALTTKLASWDDVHLFVGHALGRLEPALAKPYLSIRSQAASVAKCEALEDGTGIYQIPHLIRAISGLIGDAGFDPDLGRQAIMAELEYEQIMSTPSASATALVAKAFDDRLPVAFIADTHLPHDLVAKMLHAAGLPSQQLVVSSHEGCGNRNGELLMRLIDKAHVDPSEVGYVAPSSVGHQPSDQTGARLLVPAFGPNATSAMSIDLRENRTPMDSLTLRQASDKLAGTGQQEPTWSEVHDAAVGCLMVGFGSWLGCLVDEHEPDSIVFHGAMGHKLHQVMLELRPNISPLLMHAFPASSGPTTVRMVDQFIASTRLAPTDRVIVVGTSLDESDHQSLASMLTQFCTATPPIVATLLDDQTNHRSWPTRSWSDHCREQSPLDRLDNHQLASLVSTAFQPPGDVDTGPTKGSGTDLDPICAFAREMANWMGIAPPHVSCALMEPVARLLANPPTGDESPLATVFGGAESIRTAFELV